ncbi:MAG: DNA-binding NarL/FixJ family response regulator [Planctomycetota bacterium]|jgi:DNA-binding NarL/FixJ family response regulator
MSTTRILLVDDHALLRSAVAAQLDNEPDLEIVGQAANAEEGMAMASALSPDIIVMDIDMPGLICFDAVRRIVARQPDSRIAFLSAFSHDHYIDQALEVQARGYLTKHEPPEVLVRAIREIAAGGAYFSEEVRRRLVVDSKGVHLSKGAKTVADKLTRREVEVLRYVARGLSKKEIARTMSLSTKTIENHSSNLMSKLDIHDRVELARYAIREGLAEA